MNLLSARLNESLELYADVLMNPTFPDKELERLRGQTLATIQQEKAQPQAIINRVTPKLLFGEGHAYANPASGSGTEEAVSSLKSTDLAAFYKRWVRPDNSTLLVVGDTTLAAIQPLLEQHFGAWRAPAEARAEEEHRERAAAGQAARVSSSIARVPNSRRSWRSPWGRRAPIRITSASWRSTPCSAATSPRA